MQFIDKIETIDELKTFKKQLGKTIERKLGSPLGERKLNEAVADFLGVRDFNTAMGIISLKNETIRNVDFFEEVSKKPKKDKAETASLMVRTWVFFLNQIAVKNILSEEEIQVIIDDFIFDFFGSSQQISDNINNQGWASQINAIINSGYINEFVKELSAHNKLTDHSIAYILSGAMTFLQNNPEQDEYEKKDIIKLPKEYFN